MPTEMNPIIIDTDPGVDDAIALLYCSLMKFNIIGLTAVHGNTSLENITNNAVYLRNALFDKNVKVYKGKAVSLDGKSYSAKSSGSSGIGNLQTPESDDFSDRTAVEFIAESLRSNDKTDVIALGPLTNIADLCISHPKLTEKINALYVMGGVFGERGNMSEFAEFNVFCDPKAFKFVLDFCNEKNINTNIIPADVCRKMILTSSDLSELETLTSMLELGEIVRPYVDYYEHDSEYGGFSGAVIYDLLVPLYMQYPELFEAVQASVHVETDQNKEYGLTTFTPDSTSSIKITRNVKAKALKRKFLDDVKKASSVKI